MSKSSDANETLRNWALDDEEYPVLYATETAEMINEALDENDDFEAFRLIVDLKDSLPKLDEEELQKWAEIEPQINDERWETFFKAVVKDVFGEHEYDVTLDWANHEPLKEEWAPLEPLTEGPGPFDDLNIILSDADYYGTE